MSAVCARPVQVAGAPIHPCTFREVVSRILEHARRGGAPEFIVTPNAHHVVLLHESERFRRVYADAWLSVADGMSVVWAAKLLGTPVPEKVSGSDLFPAVCKAAAGSGIRVFLLGGRPGAAEQAARVLRERYTGLEIAGTLCPPMGFENDPAECERVNRAIREAAPHVLFVGLGAPKQEYWMYRNRAEVGVPVSIGVGGSFDFVAGITPRAPKRLRNAGLEWLYRLSREPRRLWKRYALTNPAFVRLVLLQYLRTRFTARASPS